MEIITLQEIEALEHKINTILKPLILEIKSLTNKTFFKSSEFFA